MSSESVRFKTEQLPVGSRLSHPINDGGDRLLLAAGVLITARIKERLISRGITEVLLHPDDAATLLGKSRHVQSPAKSAQPKKKTAARQPARKQTPLHETVAQIKAQASTLAASVSRQIQNNGPPLKERQVHRGTEPYDAQQRKRLAQNFSVTTQLLDKIVQQAMAGRVHDDRLLKIAAQNYVTELADDTDNVIATSNEIVDSPAVTERGVRLALLGMAMAIELDWDETNVREVGLCGLVHDLGILRLESRFHDLKAKLSEADWAELDNHPWHTLDMLTSMKSISLPVRLAATQVHENPDGSGYPGGLKSDEIHPYAAALHAADAYLTLTAGTRGRPPIISYDVMVYLLHQVKAGRMEEQAVRALLQVVSLFPIGSHVRLSDGTEAQVIRRNGQNYTTPIVQRVGADRQARYDSAHASIIDLAQAKMRVMAPLPYPERDEERVDESLMNQVLWESAI